MYLNAFFKKKKTDKDQCCALLHAFHKRIPLTMLNSNLQQGEMRTDNACNNFIIETQYCNWDVVGYTAAFSRHGTAALKISYALSLCAGVRLSYVQVGNASDRYVRNFTGQDWACLLQIMQALGLDAEYDLYQDPAVSWREVRSLLKLLTDENPPK